ncbi:MAG: DUF262 domain-containing protein [Sedimentisphaerales bacterium]|nr:DUF262 domain-containing protein [Sedimentisphaerales bacterium]
MVRERAAKIQDESEKDLLSFTYDITSYGADWTVQVLVKKLQEGSVFIPPFQRSFIWTIRDASRFIESLLLGLPVPGIFLSKEQESQKLLVIDGQQRLQTLRTFAEGLFKGKEFKLKEVQEAFEGRTYRTLEPEDKLRLDDSIIHATVVKQEQPSDDDSSIYHIFERINTGGRQLVPQEIRACIYHGEFNDLLGILKDNIHWRVIFGKPNNRMKDQELILRFFALYFDFDHYERPIKEFLNKCMGKNRSFKKHNREELEKVFCPTVEFLSRTLGKKAFRPERALNAAVYDAVMVAVARRLMKGPIKDHEGFKQKYNMLLRDEEFLKAWKTATSDEPNVRKRIQIATEKFEDLR